MGMEYIKKVLSSGKYVGIFLATTLAIAIVYLMALVAPENFGAKGPAHLVFNWIFAILMPALIGLVVAVQLYSQFERKTCPVSSTTSGTFGGLIGIATVACPACPAVLLGWIGLGAAIPSAILSSVWLKSLSLVLLVGALWFATKGQE